LIVTNHLPIKPNPIILTILRPTTITTIHLPYSLSFYSICWTCYSRRSTLELLLRLCWDECI